jgi:hypothetical protein
MSRFAFLFLVATACAARTSPEALQAVHLSFKNSPGAGRYLEILLINGGQARIGYHACAHSLERQVGSDWQVVSSLPYSEPLPRVERVCTTGLPSLNAGDTTTLQTRLPPTIQPGRYRIHFPDIPLEPNTAARLGGAYTPPFSIP